MNQPARTSSEQPPPQPHQKPKLRWFQFGMRSLFIVMTLVCVGLGWLIHHVRQREAVVLMIEELGGRIEFGEPSFLGRRAVVRSLFGEQAFSPITDVYLGERTSKEHLVQLQKLTELQTLWLYRPQVTDLSPLAGMKALTSLNLDNTQVSDLSPLAGMKGLELLILSNTQVSDLSPLAGLKELTWLYLDNTQVSDLSPLDGMKALTTLYLRNTPVSDLSPLAGMKGLETIILNNAPVSDLSPLTGMKGLTGLDLRNTQVSDLSPLAGMKNLQVIYLEQDQKVLIPASLEKAIMRF